MRPISLLGIALAGVALATLSGSCILQAPPGYVASGTAALEVNVDRPGSDYRSFDLASGRPEECRDTCGVEPQCVAFTFVNPGVQAPSARCWLKSAVPAPTPNNCCISGVKNAPPPPPAYPAEPAPPPPAPPPVPESAAPPPPPPESFRGLEMNVDRPGGDYQNFDLPGPRPHECRE